MFVYILLILSLFQPILLKMFLLCISLPSLFHMYHIAFYSYSFIHLQRRLVDRSGTSFLLVGVSFLSTFIAICIPLFIIFIFGCWGPTMNTFMLSLYSFHKFFVKNAFLTINAIWTRPFLFSKFFFTA